MLLSEASKKYQQDKKIGGYSLRTLKTYCFQYNLLLRFFGDVVMNEFSTEKLIEYLIQSGDHLKPSSLGHRVRCVKSLFRETVHFDRNKLESFHSAFEGRKWDVIFDQICYSSIDAHNSIHVFKNKTKKYVFTSTSSVYDILDRELSEDDFNPYS